MPYKVLIVYFFLNIMAVVYSVSVVKVPLGAIFEDSNKDEMLAFEAVIDLINKQKNHNYVLKPFINHIVKPKVPETFQTNINDINWSNPFGALEIACNMLQKGVIGIFTSLSENNVNAVQSMCDAKEIPIIRVTPDRELKRECCSVNVFPYVPSLAKAYASLVEYWNWKSFSILYESHDSFMNIAEILKLYNTSYSHKVLIQQLRQNDYGEYLTILKEIKKSGQTNFVLHCSIDNLKYILNQAQQVGMMTKKYNYVIINLDLHTINLKVYQYSGVNITGLRLMDPTKHAIIKMSKALQNKRRKFNMETYEPHIAAWKITTTTALIADAVMLFVETLKDIEEFNAVRLWCNSSESWEHGSTIFNYVKMKSYKGLTGLVQFDHKGFRSNFNLDVVALKQGGITKIGTWDQKDMLQINIENEETIESDITSLKNKHLNVMIIWSEPYAQYKNSSSQLVGNDQFEGFTIDLIDELSKLEGFTYTLIRNEDDKNGDYDETTKTWNGMIGDILSGKGDIAIGDMAITYEREQFVDFTTPFMDLGIQILYPRPTKPTPDFFSFAYPFDWDVWICIAISYLIVSLGLYIMARLCPQEWENWDPCTQNSDKLLNQFHLRNSFWFVLGSFMQQGCEVAPRAAATRVLSSFFAFFILVIVSFYKAQLAASLTTEVLESPFNNAEELMKRAEKLGISYGAVANEATHTFFQNSEEEVYRKIGEYMDNHPENMVEDTWEGYLKVMKGNYAFFMESVTIKFIINAVCDLTNIGDRLGERYFGIAMRKNSPYRNRLSEAILKLKENGEVDKLQRKWWEDYLGADLCQAPKPSSVAPPLTLHHVAGIFWITIGGVLLAFVLVFVELGLHVYYRRGHHNWKVFITEFKKHIMFGFKLNKTIKTMKNGKIADKEEINGDMEQIS